MRFNLKMPAFLSQVKKPAILSRLSKRTIWVLTAAIVLIGGGGFAYYRLAYLPSQASEEPALQTAVVRQGDLVIYASGSGTLIAANEADLGFETSGQVTGIFVEVGQEVKAGDLLAQVDDHDAQIAYAQAKRDLAELTSPAALAAAQQAIAAAEIDLANATSTLGYLISPIVLRRETELKEAEQALADARAIAEASPSDKGAQETLAAAQAGWERAKANLSSAQVYYENTYLPAHFTRWDGVTGKKYVARPSEAEILSARAAVAAAQAALEEARYYYTALTGGEVPEEATGSSLQTLEDARLALESAQVDLDGTRLIAPISGTVMSIETSVGDTVGSGTVMTLADLSRPILEVFLDESDWANIGVGYEAEVVFDILPERTFKGVVRQVDPALYTESNSSVVRALVELVNVDEETFNLPFGTSASVDVIGGRAENAILVPVEALRKAGDQYTVFVMENGSPRLRVVEVGIQDLLYAEIKSGLEAGDVVTTGITETK